MTTIDTHGAHGHAHGGGHGHDESYLASKGSLWADILNWATTIDHKKIGIMYLFATLFMFFLGGMAALMVRLELWAPVRQVTENGVTHTVGQFFAIAGNSASDNNAIYNRLFTLHGAIMVFMFIIPSIPAALGNFLLPLMIGAKALASPRRNLASWSLYVIGSIWAVAAILIGGVDTGWTFYTPYSTTTDAESSRVILMVTGVFILGFSSIFTGLNFVV